MSNNEISQQIIKLYEQFHWPQLDLPHLRYADIEPVVSSLGAKSAISSEQLGCSYRDVPIRRLTIGSGRLCVLAWTQMHGDESTATAAVLDWLNMLTSSASCGLPADWMKQVTLHIIPMLNPDGAAQHTRHNAQGIDINRDAVALQTPEGRILARQVEQLKPVVAFNLHDQNPYYTVGDSKTPATISFLAPAYNDAKDVDSARKRAKQIIAAMYASIKEYLPGGVGRYDDTYSYRSFGDNIAKAGASTILIESGAHHNDPNRQIARKMNVLALHTALHSLLENTFENYTLEDYYAIAPNHEDGLSDLKISAATMGDPGFKCDIAINTDRRSGVSQIEAVGDLSNISGFTDLEGASTRVVPRKGYEITTPFTLTTSAYRDLLIQGYCYFYGQTELLTVETEMPVLICETADALGACATPGEPAFMLLYQDTSPYLAILDGEVVALNLV